MRVPFYIWTVSFQLPVFSHLWLWESSSALFASNVFVFLQFTFSTFFTFLLFDFKKRKGEMENAVTVKNTLVISLVNKAMVLFTKPGSLEKKKIYIYICLHYRTLSSLQNSLFKDLNEARWMGWWEDTCIIKDHFVFLNAELDTPLMMLRSHVYSRQNVLHKILKVVMDSLWSYWKNHVDLLLLLIFCRL